MLLGIVVAASTPAQDAEPSVYPLPRSPVTGMSRAELLHFLRTRTTARPGKREGLVGQTAATYHEFFERFGRAGAAELADDLDRGLALQGAWEACGQPAGSVLVSHSGRTRGTPSAQLEGFLQFVESEVGVSLPDWWTGAFRRVYADRSGQTAMYGPEGERERRPDEIERRGTKFRIRAGGREATVDSLPAVVLKEWSIFGGSNFTAALGGDRHLLAFPETGRETYLLHAVRAGTGELLWSTTAWSTRPLGVVILGYVSRWQELRQTADTAVLFTRCEGQAVQVFDLKTGRPFLRFSSNYWRWPTDDRKIPEGPADPVTRVASRK